MEYKELIEKASSVIDARKVGDYLIGDVGCALETIDEEVYTGVCAGIDANTFCAEKTAIGAMLTDNHANIKTIVATWKNEDGEVFIIPPCGNCRELIKQVDEKNLETRVILSVEKIVTVEELLPYHNSWEKI